MHELTYDSTKRERLRCSTLKASTDTSQGTTRGSNEMRNKHERQEKDVYEQAATDTAAERDILEKVHIPTTKR